MLHKIDTLASVIPLIGQAGLFSERCAVISDGMQYSYATVLRHSEGIADWLLRGREDLNEERIAFLIRPSFLYVAVQWAIWRAGGIAVPLCNEHPPAAIRHVLADAGATLLILEHEPGPVWMLELGNIPVLVPPLEAPSVITLPRISPLRRAMILYTSGTTNKPKGVVFTHQQISHQIQCLVDAWHWGESDHILNVLPLHHVHGIINVVCCALWVGATVQFIERFDPPLVWQKLTEGTINIFMAVPTVYYKLIDHWHQQSDDRREHWSKAVCGFRLMVSGSAALPIAVLEQWKNISGHILLERYGMTEIGMALSNPYHGERRPGHVGTPLPGVAIRLVDNEKNIKTVGVAGEIQVKGPMVFAEYWNNPTATQAAFTADGWFKTGDIARINNGYYQILGRDSVDIIKSGGYKISALEIEEALREHPLIRDCAVVGIPNAEWGEIIGAAVVTNGEKLNQEELKQWLKEYIPSYKVPRMYTLVADLPRNAMGKVTKKEVVKLF